MGSDRARSAAPVVLLDANLLYPFHIRNLLVQLGVSGVIDVRWTDAIHGEWIRNLAGAGRQSPDRLIRTRDIMNRVLPSADVRGYEHRISGLTLPDPADRHVLAAAIEAGASVLLTFNLRDFPDDLSAPFAIAARGPDGFICEISDRDPELMIAIADAARQNLSRTAPDMVAFADTLERQRLPRFAARLRAAI